MCKTSKKESRTFVKDCRRPAAYESNQKVLKYPKNYDDIVKYGFVKERGDVDDDGAKVLQLVYGKKDKKETRPMYTLHRVGTRLKGEEEASTHYYTIYLLAGDNTARELHKSCYEPFGFSSLDLRKYFPVFEIQKTGDTYKLVHSRFLAKKGCSLNEIGEVNEEDRVEKGRNGKLMYFAEYDFQDTTFYVIRNPFGKIEVDKTILNVPLALSASLLKLIGKIITYLPMKLGGYLLRKQNKIARFFGHIFFAPFVPIKLVFNLSAVLGKSPILLFVANEKKYGDCYWTLWKHELMDCFKELVRDIELIKDGKKSPKNSKYVAEGAKCKIFGTWKELDAYRKVFDMYEKQYDLEQV